MTTTNSRARRRASAAAMLLALALPCAQVQGQSPDIRVDPGVELLGLVFRLAGAQEYNMCAFPRYQAAADAWFAPHRGHRVVALTRQVREQGRIAFDAVQSIAIHLGPPPDLVPRVPLTDTTRALDRRWRNVDVEEYVKALREFARDSRFTEFLESQRPLTDQVVHRLDALFQAEVRFEWFAQFFGARPAARFQLTPGLCNGAGNFGPLFRDAQDREELHAIIAVGSVDSAGLPQFHRSMVPTIVHEFNHSYVNPIVRPVWTRFQAASEAIYPTVAEEMRGLAYGTAETMLNESLVRAGVVRYLAATQGQPAAEAETASQIGLGFLWMGELVERLGQYERERTTYPTLATFLPVLARYWDSLPARVDSMSRALDARRPLLVEMSPADGATNVDPGTTRMTLRFDRPMRGGWSLNPSGTPGAAWPDPSGLEWDATRTTLSFTVRLEPGRRYELTLQGSGFRSADAVPLKRRVVRFDTRP